MVDSSNEYFDDQNYVRELQKDQVLDYNHDQSGEANEERQFFIQDLKKAKMEKQIQRLDFDILEKKQIISKGNGKVSIVV